jgi:molybdopterin synthase sulfur carrier subunit
MEIKVKYFAKYREQLGLSEEQIRCSETRQDIDSLKRLLASRGRNWKSIFENNTQLLVAINQEIIKTNSTLKSGDEVAFYPPVSGG